MHVSRSGRIAGGLMGLLVGDALGVPYEFHPPAALPTAELLEMEPPEGFDRAHPGIRPGTWSDDGAQALILLDSLHRNRRFVLADFAQGLLQWRDEGRFAVDGRVFDIGMQTASALNRLRSGMAPELSGGDGERDNGNGSLMRVLPLALWYRGTDLDLARVAMRQSLPTHRHARSLVACIQLCLWARGIYAYEDTEDAWEVAADALPDICLALGLPACEVAQVLDPVHGDRVDGTGYVVDTLWSARACLSSTDNFESAVKAAIALGNDTDTTAAVTGGLAGIKYGFDGIPERWRQALRGQNLVTPLLDALEERLHEQSRLHRGVAWTSDAVPLQVSWLEMEGGRLGGSLCPGLRVHSVEGDVRIDHRRSLEQDLLCLADKRVDAVISLLEPDELIDMGVEAMPLECERLGIVWVHLPMPNAAGMRDFFEQELAAALPRLRGILSRGGQLVVHGDGWDGRLRAGMARILIALHGSGWERRAARVAGALSKELRHTMMAATADS